MRRPCLVPVLLLLLLLSLASVQAASVADDWAEAASDLLNNGKDGTLLSQQARDDGDSPLHSSTQPSQADHEEDWEEADEDLQQWVHEDMSEKEARFASEQELEEWAKLDVIENSAVDLENQQLVDVAKAAASTLIHGIVRGEEEDGSLTMQSDEIREAMESAAMLRAQHLDLEQVDASSTGLEADLTLSSESPILRNSTTGLMYSGNRLVPNMFMVGCQKCGTTTLWAYLLSQQFGRGAVCCNKELKFFGARLPKKHPVVRYRSRFPKLSDPAVANGTLRWVMDGTPDYLYQLLVPAQIQRMYGSLAEELKFVAILRDPKFRYLSWFNHIGRKFQRIPCSTTFDEWAPLEVKRTQACMEAHQQWETAGVYSKCGTHYMGLFGAWYAIQFHAWFRVFPPDPVKNNWLILDFADLQDDRMRTIDQLFSFLGMSHISLPDVEYHRNPAENHNGLWCPNQKVQEVMLNTTAELLDRFFAPLSAQLVPVLRNANLSHMTPTFAKSAVELLKSKPQHR
eukprot:jgi/Chlat1/435/Chrsp103S01011